VDPRPDSVLCLSASGFHRMAYVTWGEERAERTVVCVHGLTGNASDFDELAATLAREGYRVVCPDVVGRGGSDRLDDPEGYGLRQYRADMACLIARLRLAAVDWVGTSMGGLVGVTLAALPRAPLRRLVLNDIGPWVRAAALQRLGTMLGTDPRFADLAEAERWLRKVRAPSGPLTDKQWRRMAERSVRRGEDGALRLHFDPAIARPFARTSHRDLDVWSVWDRIECPTLVLRGEHSDVLLRETAEEMAERGPRAEVMEIGGCGHPPALVDGDQIALITEWLRRTRS